MHKITLRLTDDEYAVLEARAGAERRTVREMAAYLVTQHPFTFTNPPAVPIGPAPINPVWPGNVWCDTNGASGTQYPPLPIGTSGRHA